MTTATALPFHPVPPVMSFLAYGVSIEFGEDHVIAEGHPTMQRFVAAANKVARTECGLVNVCDDHGMTYAEVVKGVKRVWAIRQPKCDCTAQLNEYGVCENDLHDTDRVPEFWHIQWHYNGEQFTAETPGARPYTLL